MRKLTLLFLILATGISSCFAKSNVGDWQTVQQDIPHGWQIIVVTSMTFPCTFDRATDQELICKAPEGYGSQEVQINRGRIHEIRVEKRNGANALAFGAVAGLAGAGISATGTRAGSAYLFGLAGSALGASAGSHTHILRGKVIYRRDIPQQATRLTGCGTCETFASSTSKRVKRSHGEF